MIIFRCSDRISVKRKMLANGLERIKAVQCPHDYIGHLPVIKQAHFNNVL